MTERKSVLLRLDPAVHDALARWAGDELRSYLRGRAPDYMVPAAFTTVAALPLTAHGKVDRRTLARWSPLPEERTVQAPRTPLEELLAGIFAEVLGVQRIGVEASFFESGGHSLSAMRLVSRVREALGVELPLHRLFAAPTVAALARGIETIARRAVPPVPLLTQVPRDQPLPALPTDAPWSASVTSPLVIGWLNIG